MGVMAPQAEQRAVRRRITVQRDITDNVIDLSAVKKIGDALQADAEVRSGPAAELSLPTERHLIDRWKRHGDRNALHRLVMTMQPFLRSVARRHGRRAGIEGDLINEGVMAVIAALHRYEPVDDTRFISFAWRRIVSAMSLARQRTERIVDRPCEKSGRSRASGRRDIPGDGSHSSIDEMDESVLQSEAANPERLLAEAERNRDLAKVVARAIEELTKFERELIMRRLEERCLVTVADRHGVPEDLARRIEARALQKMRMNLIRSGYSGVNTGQGCWQD